MKIVIDTEKSEAPEGYELTGDCSGVTGRLDDIPNECRPTDLSVWVQKELSE